MTRVRLDAGNDDRTSWRSPTVPTTARPASIPLRWCVSGLGAQSRNCRLLFSAGHTRADPPRVCFTPWTCLPTPTNRGIPPAFHCCPEIIFLELFAQLRSAPSRITRRRIIRQPTMLCRSAASSSGSIEGVKIADRIVFVPPVNVLVCFMSITGNKRSLIEPDIIASSNASH